MQTLLFFANFQQSASDQWCLDAIILLGDHIISI